jgi:hypothetical protein
MLGSSPLLQRALSRTLRDALDVYHQKFSETVVKIVRLEEIGVSVEQVCLLSSPFHDCNLPMLTRLFAPQ